MEKNKGKKKGKCFIDKGVKSIVLGIFMVSFILAIPQIYTGVEAAVVSGGESQEDIIPKEVGVKGNKENPFVILEILPYEGYAEIGYLIEGCEPLDMNKLRYSEEMKTVTTIKASTAEWGIRQQFVDEEGIPDNWNAVNNTITLYGYYEKVENNKGIFHEEVDTSTGKINYVKIGENQGNIVWKTLFQINQSRVDEKRKFGDIGDKVYTYRTDNQYKEGYAYSYDHKQQFLKEVLEIPEDQIYNYEIMVKTVEANDLNIQLEWIDRADLISISPKSHIGGLPEVWEKYNLAGKEARVDSRDFASNDLSWEAVLKIFKKVNIEEDYAAIIFDWGVYTNPPTSTSERKVINHQINYDGEIINRANSPQIGNKNNVYKLALMSRTMNPVLFYNLFLNDGQGTGSALIQNGSYTIQPNESAQIYWNQSTFMFSQKDGSFAWDTHWNALWDKYQLNPNMGDNVSVSGRVYSYNGDNSLSQHFVDNVVADSKFTKEFQDYLIEKEITSRSPSYAIQYILGLQNKVAVENKDIRVLDLQPSNDFTLTSFRLRMLIPQNIGKIDIVHMTSAEFVGKIEDLNSSYDLIYMGMNCGGYVTRQISNPDYGKSTSSEARYLQLPDYNDNSLDGKIYLHVGDKITGNSRHGVNWISRDNEKDTTRLPGNDITKSKKEDLLEFLEAGYPILVESMLYHTGTDLTKLVVDKSSNIYTFIDENKGQDNMINVESLPNPRTSSNILRDKPILEILSAPKAYVGTSENGIINNNQYINSENINYRNLIFNYKIIVEDTSKRFDIKLFIDANSDGRFDEETELNMIQRGMSPNETHTLAKRLSRDYFGVIPWKLQIVDSSDANNRDEITGISAVKRAVSEKEIIRVLQVNQNSNSTLKLEGDSNFKNFTENLNDYKVIFKTISISEFERWYPNRNSFDNSSEERKRNTDKLKDYNMLIFGFADMYGSITNQYALNNILYSIEQGKSVLFTHDITSFNNDEGQKNQYGYYFNRDYRDILGMDRFGIRNIEGLKLYNDIAKSPEGVDYSQKHGYTYYALKRIANSNQSMTYKGIVPNDNNNTTKSVSKLNDGQITQYPYYIDENIVVADTHAQYYQLNLDDPSIIVWYCLSGSDSVYAASPNDASNNYYIYNKGNITYSGVGHSRVGESKMEVKLFVNTMIAAYRAGVEPPMIEIVNEEECIFTPGEIYGENEYLEIEFIPWDFSLSSQELGVIVQLEDARELEIYDKLGKKMEEIFTAKDGRSCIKLENGNVYYARYKRSLFSNVNLRLVKFYIENQGGLHGYKELELKERVLFNLY